MNYREPAWMRKHRETCTPEWCRQAIADAKARRDQPYVDKHTHTYWRNRVVDLEALMARITEGNLT